MPSPTSQKREGKVGCSTGCSQHLTAPRESPTLGLGVSQPVLWRSEKAGSTGVRKSLMWVPLGASVSEEGLSL